MDTPSYEREVELDLDKKYVMPENLKVIYFQDKILVIAVETGNWIVLNNTTQLEIFNKLEKYSIGETLELFPDSEEDILTVLMQIEAKDFTCMSVQRPSATKGLCIYLTNACNLRCQHCYMYADVKLENELNFDSIKQVLLDFKASGGEAVTLTGGEVALRKDFFDILKVAKQDAKLLVTVLSNGILWNEEMIEQSLPYIDEIQVSIDGYDEASNAKIRGVKGFDKVLHAIDLLVNKNMKVTLAITPMFENLKEYQDQYISFAQALINKYKHHQFQIKFSYELIEGRNVKETKKINKEYRSLINEIVETIYPGTEKNVFVLNHENNFLFENCGYGGLSLSSTGDVYFCNRIFEINSYGNIHKSSFSKIMALAKQAEKVSNINNLRPCNQCDLMYICGGGCRIKNFPALTKIPDLFAFDADQIPPRSCTMEEKEKYYQLMIDTNDALYR